MSGAVLTHPWWMREDLYVDQGQLVFAGRSATDLARQFGTPTFVYNGRRVEDNLRRLRAALGGAGFGGKFQIRYAMKANRFAPLLTFIKSTGLAGIDACSPNEVEHAVSCGFSPEEVSFTATCLSERDLERLNRFDGMRINCDSIHAIRRWGQLGPGRTIGIRVNPGLGVGRAENDKLHYAGAVTTKFGIYREQFAEALRVASEYDLTVDTIHFHTGCGYLNAQLPHWENILEACCWFIDQVATVERVNVGGGLGVPHVESDQPLDLERWAGILAKHFLARELEVVVEPGDYVAKDAGMMLLTSNMVEQKRDRTFVGVDAGFNLAVEPAVYGLPFQPVPAERRPGDERPVTLAGNINEALDVWYTDVELPPIESGDTIALINAGAYSSSMASNHCMRGEFREFLLI